MRFLTPGLYASICFPRDPDNYISAISIFLKIHEEFLNIRWTARHTDTSDYIFPEINIGHSDTGGKFAAGVNDTGGRQ